MRQAQWTLIAGVALALTTAACDDTLRGVQKDTQENTAAAKRAADEAGLDEAAAKAAQKAQEAAEVARRKAEEIAVDLGTRDKRPATAPADGDTSLDESLGKAKARLEEAGRAIGSEAKGAMILADVKQALMRDERVDAAHVDVDVDDDARVGTLGGSVPTAAQKGQAEAVARAKAKDYRVVNKLTVRP